MMRKPWVWFLAGWLIAMVFSPTHLIGMFKAKAS